jgi:L-lactate dehydrogenase
VNLIKSGDLILIIEARIKSEHPFHYDCYLINSKQIIYNCPKCGGCKGWQHERKKIEQKVRESAYHIINAKGSTHFAVGLALVKITSSILRRQNSVLTVSVKLSGEYGISDVCLSLPAIVSDTGIVRIVDGPLSAEEKELLQYSASVLKEAIDSLNQ